MLDKLPNELSLPILQTAATELRFTHRQSVVNLALTSNSVYNIVAPILYHTIIITNKTRDLIAAFTRDESTREAAKRVCSHVRVLLDDDSEETSINPDLLLNVFSVSVVVELARAIAEAQCQALPTSPSLRELTISSTDFSASINSIPQRSRELITHVTGFLPIFPTDEDWTMFFSFSDEPVHGPERWTRSIIDNLPALTHFGFVMGSTSSEEFDLQALGKALKTVLSYLRLKKVVLKVCGIYIEECREEIETALNRIYDPRLGVVWEERPLTRWKEYDVWSREDEIAGRSIWTQAVPV